MFEVLSKLLLFTGCVTYCALYGCVLSMSSISSTEPLQSLAFTYVPFFFRVLPLFLFSPPSLPLSLSWLLSLHLFPAQMSDSDE